jgi:nucleoside-diphosphate-sugar epimerase
VTRILCSGGAGFIGSALVRRLCAEGHDVVVLDDMSRGKASRLAGLPCQVWHGDVRDEATVRNAMHGCETVMHLASKQSTQTFYDEPRQVLDVAIRGMLNVLSACEANGTGNLLYVSSSEAYQVATVVPTPETVGLSTPDPLNPRFSYGGGKAACEIMGNAWARTGGVLDRFTIIRPHNIYGDDGGYEHVIPEFATRITRLIAEHPGDGPLPFNIQGTGLETRSFCHISDCVDAFMLLLEKVPEGQHIFHVGTPEEVTIAHLAQLIGAHYGREVKVVPGTLPKGSPPRRCPDITKMRALGYEPKVMLAEGIGPVLDWYRDHPKSAGSGVAA